ISDPGRTADQACHQQGAGQPVIGVDGAFPGRGHTPETAHRVQPGRIAQQPVGAEPERQPRGPGGAGHAGPSGQAASSAAVTSGARTAMRTHSPSGPVATPGYVSPRRTAKPRPRRAARVPSGQRTSTNGARAGPTGVIPRA